MVTLKYTVIKSKSQHKEYCHILEKLVESGTKGKSVADEIDLLTLLIENWMRNKTVSWKWTLRLLHSFMSDHGMKAKDLVKLLKMSKGYVSDILNFKNPLRLEFDGLACLAG